MKDTQKSSLPSIDSLVVTINQKHEEVLGLARNTVDKKREIGELLIEVKKQLEHGDLTPFIKSRCAFGQRTAQLYMRLALQLPKLDAEKAKEISQLPMSAALKALSSKKKLEPSGLIQPVPESTPQHDQAEGSPGATRAIPEAHGAQSATATKIGPAAEAEPLPESQGEEVTEAEFSPIHEPATELLHRVLDFLQVNSVAVDAERQAIARVRAVIEEELSMLLEA